MAKKKKHSGHYCRICGSYKPNEQFSGKGHAQHVCKECHALPKEEREDMVRCNQIERAAFKYPMSRQDWELLEKYAKKYNDKESGRFAQDMLDMKRGCREEIDELEHTPYSEVYEYLQEDIMDYLEESIHDFILDKGYIPETKHLNQIAKQTLKVFSDDEILIVSDDAFRRLVDNLLINVVTEMKKDGIEICSYEDSIVVTETERLIIRKLTRDDLVALYTIMSKPEVMYAWEHGFTKTEVRQWINRQLTRYKKDGLGYFAVISKKSGQLIGQAGLMRSEFNGTQVVELGYILDNLYWHQGYATEASEALMDYGFHQKHLDSIYCSIRPMNESSIRVAERLGMKRRGEHIVNYRGQEMPHLIFVAKPARKCMPLNIANNEPNAKTKAAIEEACSGKLRDTPAIDTSSVEAMFKSVK